MQNKANFPGTPIWAPKRILPRLGALSRLAQRRRAAQESGVPRPCQTKPIGCQGSAGRETPVFHYSIIPPFQSEVDCAKRSQFPVGWGVASGTWGEGCCTNEPNSRHAGPGRWDSSPAPRPSGLRPFRGTGARSFRRGCGGGR
jgi:hypothetical protein